MKCFIFIGAILRTVHLVSANALAAMEASADTWCVTYLSTYIAAVTNQGDLPSAENSGRLPFAPSLRPTFARNTSVSITRSAMSTDIGPESALFTSDVISTADTPPIDSESSDLDADPTAVQESSAPLTLTDGFSTAVTLTTDAEPTSTSTDIIEPAGRNVIFLIQTGVNEKRSFYKRANNEFVGENNPDVCTFAATFNLAEDEGQFFTGGLPIHYSGDGYKELLPQGRPPSGSVMSGFTESGGTLAFRNSELPNGEAGFCQDADGQVYITFTSGPSGCTPVSLGIYNVQQCRDGRLVGLDELTSSVPGTVTATAEESPSTQSTIPRELPESSGLVPSESTISASQTSEIEASITPSSFVTDSSTQESDDPASESPTASTSEPAIETSDSLDSITTSGVESEATTVIETSNIETTMITSLPETTVISGTTETTGVDTSTTEVVNDVDTTATTDTTVATDTTTTIEGDASNTEVTSDIDTTTADTIDTTTTNADTTTLPENPTTTEAETTTAEITTTAEPTTTTAAVPEPQPGCGTTSNPYTYSSVTFDLLCGRDWAVTNIGVVSVQSFGDCLRACALNSQCNGIGWSPPSFCVLGSQVNDNGADSRYDAAKVVSRSQ